MIEDITAGKRPMESVDSPELNIRVKRRGFNIPSSSRRASFFAAAAAARTEFNSAARALAANVVPVEVLELARTGAPLKSAH